MKKRFAVSTWATLLMILLMMVACGPAVSTEQADEMTREAGGAEQTETGTGAEESATDGTVELTPGI